MAEPKSFAFFFAFIKCFVLTKTLLKKSRSSNKIANFKKRETLNPNLIEVYTSILSHFQKQLLIHPVRSDASFLFLLERD